MRRNEGKAREFSVVSQTFGCVSDVALTWACEWKLMESQWQKSQHLPIGNASSRWWFLIESIAKLNRNDGINCGAQTRRKNAEKTHRKSNFRPSSHITKQHHSPDIPAHNCKYTYSWHDGIYTQNRPIVKLIDCLCGSSFSSRVCKTLCACMRSCLTECVRVGAFRWLLHLLMAVVVLGRKQRANRIQHNNSIE